MVVDLSIHDKWDGNPHAHYLMTMREINENGFSKKKNGFSKKKNGDWDKNDYVLSWRKSYQDITNIYLEMDGFEQRICVDRYEKQGIDKTKTIHLGHYAHRLEQMGTESRRGNINREIHKANQEKEEINKEIALLQNKLEKEREHAEFWHDKIEHYRKVSEEVQRTADVLEHRLTQRGYLISSNNKKMLKPFCNAISPPNFQWKKLLKILLPRRKGSSHPNLRSFSSLQGCRRILDITAAFLPCGGNLTRSRNRNRWVGLRPPCHTVILRDGHLPNNADFPRSVGNRGTKLGGNIRHHCIAIRRAGALPHSRNGRESVTKPLRNRQTMPHLEEPRCGVWSWPKTNRWSSNFRLSLISSLKKKKNITTGLLYPGRNGGCVSRRNLPSSEKNMWNSRRKSRIVITVNVKNRWKNAVTCYTE